MKTKTRTATVLDDTRRVVRIYQRAKTGKLVPCHGEAHGNAFIDNCMRCAPRWGEVEELAPVDLAEARRLGMAVSFGDLTREQSEQALGMLKTGEAVQLGVEEKLKGGSRCSFFVLAWEESNGGIPEGSKT